MKNFSVLFLAVMALGLLIPSYGQNVINCPSGFASTGSCGVGSGQPLQIFNGGGTPSLSGSQILLIPTGITHGVSGFNYQTLVNVQSFTASFTFVPNGQNVAFVIQNSNNNTYFNGPAFNAGAGCEAGFFQAFGQPYPNNIFALELDSYSPVTNGGSFTYSSVQIYQSGQSPCNPNDDGPGWYFTPKISTSPVPLDSPSGTQNTTTGDTYSVTLTYDGSSLTLNMYDITAGGSCPGATCFTNSWSVNIPSWAGGNTAWVGFTGATGLTSSYPLYIDSFSFTEGSTTQTTVSTPTFTPAAGTYTSAQSVSISDATSAATIYYTTNGTTPTTSSAVYAGPITVSSSETLEAIAVKSGDTNSAVASAAYTISPTTTVSTPTFTPPAGAYTSAQTVTHHRCHLGRDHLLHHQRNDANHFIRRLCGPDHGHFVGDPGSHCRGERLHQQRRRLGCLHHNADRRRSNADLLSRGGTYTSAQSVTISDATSGATIYYTTNGTTPTTHRQSIQGRLRCSSETLEAIAVASGYTNSAVATAAYTINLSTAATPTFSPPAGTYTSAQTVSITDATSGATIYYTTNGTTPTTSSAVYSGPITVARRRPWKPSRSRPATPTARSRRCLHHKLPAPPPTVSTPTFSPAGRGLYFGADGDHLRRHHWRNHLLHHQRNHADDFFDQSIRPDHGQLDRDAGGDRGGHGRHQQRSRVRRLHHNLHAAYGLNADLLTCRRDLYLRAVGDHLRCHCRRNHLLHHQRNHADHLLEPVHRPDYGQRDGDAGGDRGSHGRHQQRGRVRRLHHNAAICATYGLNADLLTPRRGLYLRAVGDHLRCHLPAQPSTTPPTELRRPPPRPVHRPDYGQRDGDPGGDRGCHGRHQQRGRVRRLHHKLRAAYGLNADLHTRQREPIPPRRR